MSKHSMRPSLDAAVDAAVQKREQQEQQEQQMQQPQRQKADKAVLERLAALLQMEERLRQAEGDEIPFIVVNETKLLVPYRQAVLWRADSHGGLVPMAVSGLAVLEKNAPYLQWLQKVCLHLVREGVMPEGRPFSISDIPEALREEWATWLPTWGSIIPLPLWEKEKSVAPQSVGTESAEKKANAPVFGFLALFSQQSFAPAQLRLVQHLAGAYGFALSVHHSTGTVRSLFAGKTKIIAAVLACVFLLPFRQSVLVPAEVIAHDPWPVRSPLDGVVEHITVQPNATVRQGETLLSLDTTELQTRLAVAVKTLEVSKVELRQARQQALGNQEAKLRLAQLSGRVEQLEAERNYIEELLARAEIQSPVDGVALVDSPEDWAGRPVSVGQRIMTVADPNNVALEIFLPMEDYLPMEEGDSVLFFPNVSPGSPYTARIYLVGFQSAETPQAGLAFRLRADFASEKISEETAGETVGEAPLRLGVRGTAKLYGPRAPLAYNLLRKPLMKLRQWVGI